MMKYPEDFVNKIICGDNMEVMKYIPNNKMDTIITDPPYALGFMGMDWDKLGRLEYQKWTERWAREALRVAKPGATMLCFGGTRTFHRLACGIEDAGWVIKDCIMWIYGSGFPKSLDISKQIDKRGGESVGWFGKWLRRWREENNVSQKEIAKLFPSKTGRLTGCVANWELGFNMPTAKQFSKICKEFNLPFRTLKEAEREIIGKKRTNKTVYQNIGGNNKSGVVNITVPATPQAKQWEGYGTALKPAYEPIIVAIKPNEGSYANNALKWGVAGLNIDGGRIETKPRLTGTKKNGKEIKAQPSSYLGSGTRKLQASYDKKMKNNNLGRYPANIILDEEAGRMLDEQSGESISKRQKVSNKNSIWGSGNNKIDIRGHNDIGGASRFFYCAKASRKERERGCEELESKIKNDGRNINLASGNVPQNRSNNPKKNHHPTVKPLALMKYLCTLTKTPTGGIVLDPFAGSGSTLIACKETGRDFIGIEKEPEYCEIARRRILATPETLF